MGIIDKYNVIILILCRYYGIDINEFRFILKKRENKYMFLLLLKSFNCFNERNTSLELGNLSNRTVINNLKKAEEKILINKNFREEYFRLEEEIKENFKKA